MPFATSAKRLAYQARWKRQRQARWQAAGGCSRCGQPVTKFKLCQRCRAKMSQQYRKRLAKGPGGICAVCKKWKPSPARKTCRSCASRECGRIRCLTAKRHPVYGYLVRAA